MISNDGKVYIKRYLAQQVPTIASAIAFGIGGRAESSSDQSLQFEVGRVPIVLTSYDFVNDKIIFKAVLPDDFSGTIYEVALYSETDNPVAGNYSSKVLASFDSDSETWGDASTGAAPTYSTTNARIGGDSVNHAPIASATQDTVLNGVLFDLSGNSGADQFVFAYNVGNTNTASVVFRFRTDASNYYSYTISNPTSGYHFDTFAKGNAVATGTPNWADIESLEILTTSKSSGASNVDYDGIRIEDTDSINPDYAMVSRELLGTPYVKTVGKVQEIEFALSVSIT